MIIQRIHAVPRSASATQWLQMPSHGQPPDQNHIVTRRPWPLMSRAMSMPEIAALQTPLGTGTGKVSGELARVLYRSAAVSFGRLSDTVIDE